MPSPLRRCNSDGVTSTIPTRDLASPLSISRSNVEPRRTSFSLNQTETPRDSSRSCSSLAAPFRSSHAWQRKTSRTLGRDARFSTFSRTGVSDRTSAGVYTTDEPAGHAERELSAAARTADAAPPSPGCSPKRCRMRTRTWVTGSRYCGYHMRDRLLPRSLCDGLLLVLCI